MGSAVVAGAAVHPPWRLRAAALLLALSGIVFQIALTRLCSAAFNYHLAFLALSAAMLGIGAGGTWVAVWLAPAAGHRERRRLQRLAVAAAAGVALVGAAFAWLPLGSFNAPALLATLIAGYALVAVPHVCAGAALAVALRAPAGAVGLTYAADLAGAAAGCVAALALMDAAGPPWALAAAAAAALGAARSVGRLGRLAWPAGGALLLAAAAAGLQPGRPNVLPNKPLAFYLHPVLHPGATLVATRWDASARVDVFDAPGARLLWQVGVLPDQPLADLPDLRGLTIDADALSAVLRAEPDGAPSIVRRLQTSLPYEIARRRRVLVIGPGGGVDVAAALAYGAERIEAVEVNRAVADVMLGPLAGFSGHLFRRPGVLLIVDEGRSFLRRTPQRYDAIVLTAVDSWAALAAGAYSLAENYLYTLEAMGDYYDHLADGGVLAISRWYTRPPRELQRLAGMAAAALEARAARPEQALLLARSGDFGTLLVRRGRFEDAELRRAREFAAANGFSLPYEPALGGAALRRLVAGEGQPAGARPVPAPTDDRPFFFDYTPWADVLRGRAADGLPQGHAVLLVALVQGGCLAVASVLLPLRRLKAVLPGPARWPFALYFAAAGLAFMLAEVALVQRCLLLLGRPALALGVALGGLLAGAAAGSALAALAPPSVRRALPAGAALLLLAEAALLPAVVAGALTWPLAARVGLALAVLLPVAVAMGTALPVGLAALSGSGPAGRAAVPWAWGINGAASVVGAALATMLAMDAGGTAVLVVAGGLYALAAAAYLTPATLHTAERGASTTAPPPASPLAP